MGAEVISYLLPSMAACPEPTFDQVKVTFGTPLASQINLAVSRRSLAAFEVIGDFTMIGLSGKTQEVRRDPKA